MPRLIGLQSQVRVNPVTAGDQTQQQFDVSASGISVVSWFNPGNLARVIAADGTPLGNAFAVPAESQIEYLADGSVGAIYQSGNAVFFQRYDVNGNALGSAQNLTGTLGSPDIYAQVDALAGGGAAVLYRSGTEVFAVVLDAAYTAGTPFDVGNYRVVQGNATGRTLFEVHAHTNGNLVVYTQTPFPAVNPLGYSYATAAQIYAPNGSAVGTQQSVSGDVQALAGGGYAVFNSSEARLFDASGVLQSTFATNTPSNTQFAVIGGDIIAAAWSQSSLDYVQLFTFDGFKLGQPIVLQQAAPNAAEIFATTIQAVGSLGFATQTELPDSPPAAEPDDVGLQIWNILRSNIVLGTAGADELSGLGDDKLLAGRAGDDRYFVDGLGDEIVEAAGQGFDRILASAGYGIADGISIELMTTTNDGGIDPIWLVGNSFAQFIFGNEGNNTLVGNGGGDALVGLGGDDELYVVGNEDRVKEAIGGGYDRVYTRGSFVLTAGQEVEVLAFESLTANTVLNLTGNEFAQAIYGNAGVNIIDGGGGGDDMTGGDGNDTYIVRDVRDVVREDASASGGDTVRALVDFRLRAGSAVEFISAFDAASTSALLLVGNERAQLITGNAGANILDDGGVVVASPGGTDALVGLGGDDFYYVSNAGTSISEAVGGGYDRLFARTSYVLGVAEIEKLTTADNFGTEVINLTGNSLAGQVLYGNAGANQLNGGGGGDELIGLGGNDSYIIVHAGDLVYEDAGGGNDRVFASVSYNLNAGAQVEIISTTNNIGTGAIDLRGNSFDQAIYGNAGSNVLVGGGGRDDLIGLGGADKFLFDVAPNTAFVSGFGLVGPGGNVAMINDMGVDDKIWLKGSVFGLTPGALPAGAFNYGSVATDADDRILYDTATRAFLFDADGAGGAQALLIGFLKDPFVLDASFFQVI